MGYSKGKLSKMRGGRGTGGGKEDVGEEVVVGMAQGFGREWSWVLETPRKTLLVEGQGGRKKPL